MNLKTFKNKSLILINIKLIYLKNILNIIFIFIKVIIKFQVEKYPIIFYIILKVYKIYKKLKDFKIKFQVSFIFISFKIF